MKRKRAVSIKELQGTNFNLLMFEGPWQQTIGQPEVTGSWIIWGNSGNGKTRCALQLARYLASFGLKIEYNSLEEGLSNSLREAIMDCNMHEVSRWFKLLDKMSMDELIMRLERRRSADVVIIDSIQYTGMSYSDYKKLRDRFRSKLFILISHAEGKMPQGSVAKSIRYDAFVKLWVEGYRAFPISRYGGKVPYTIWDEGANDCIHNN
jgi:hypothetical protein